MFVDFACRCLFCLVFLAWLGLGLMIGVYKLCFGFVVYSWVVVVWVL